MHCVGGRLGVCLPAALECVRWRGIGGKGGKEGRLARRGRSALGVAQGQAPWRDWDNGSARERRTVQHQGNISKNGTRIYHVPGGRYYDQTRINTSKGERWFCMENEVRAAGWCRSRTSAHPHGGVHRRRRVRRAATVTSRWNHAPRSVPDISRGADATLLQPVYPDSRPEAPPW